MNLYFITGTSRGIGQELFQQLAASPQNIVVSLSRLSDRVENRTACFFTELADTISLPKTFEKAWCWAEIQCADYAKAVLINNAGVVMPVGPLDKMDSVKLAHNLTVNLTAPMILTSLFVAATRGRATRRTVINISSGAAKRPVRGWSPYCAAKAGLEMATRVAALEAETDAGLSICALAPGVIDTAMQEQLRKCSEVAFADVERFRHLKAEGLLRSAHDVAADILRLEADQVFKNGGLYDLREFTHA